MMTGVGGFVVVVALVVPLSRGGDLCAQVPDRNRLYVGPQRAADAVARIHAGFRGRLCVDAVNGESDLANAGREVEVLPGTHAIRASSCVRSPIVNLVRFEAEAGHVYQWIQAPGSRWGVTLVDSTTGLPVPNALTAGLSSG